MKRKHFEKIKRIVIAGMPSLNDMSLFIKGMVLVFVVLTSGILFNYISTANAQATKENETFSSGMWNEIIDNPAGCVGVAGWGGIKTEFSNASTTAAFGVSDVKRCQPTFDLLQGSNNSQTGQASLSPRLVEVDYGATGSLLNSNVSLYSTNIAMPGISVDYYASQIRGTAYAADNPTSGRSVLAPVFFLNQAMVNLAYALVVIVLVFSGLNILLSSLTGAEERFTLVQLLINAGITLIVITFYYEIAAIIFDLTVNYGNALVASVMSPYINAQVILDRLQPGGDLNIIAMLNTFEFTGISDSLLVVTESVATGLLPAITQSSIALNKAVTQNPAFVGFSFATGDWVGGIGHMFGLAGGISSVGISWMVSNFLGRKEIFDAVIAWAIFFINIKIFFNLLSSFITFCFMTAFGPMIVLGAITGGFEKVTYSIKSLIALGAIFPVTFLMILLGATSMNMFIKRDAGDSTTVQGGTQNASASSATVLCKYSPSDSRSVEAGIQSRDWISAGLSTVIKAWPWGGGTYKAQSDGSSAIVDDPVQFRNRYYLNQRIFDVTPFSTTGNVRDCRPSLFPTPFTFIPAPFGTIGNRALQIQTIDSLVRSFLGIVFLIIASRAPSLVEEVLEVKKIKALDGLVGAFKGGTQSFFSVGATALSVGLPLVSIGTKWASGLPGKIGFREQGSRLGGFGNAIGSLIGKARRNDNAYLQKEMAAGRLQGYTGSNGQFVVTGVNKPNRLESIWQSRMNKPSALGQFEAGDQYSKTFNSMRGQGVSLEGANLIAVQTVAQNYEKLTKQMNAFGTVVQGASSALAEMTKQTSAFVGTLQKLVTLDILEQT